MSATRRMISLARIARRAELLQKSRGGKAAGRLAVDSTRKPRKAPVYPDPGGYVRVQRPNLHEQPMLARLLSVGRHGITVADANGRSVRVRHEHVLERHAAPTGRERAGFSQALAAQGIPVPLAERFLKTDSQGRAVRRPTSSQLALLQAIGEGHGVPVDLAAVQEGATYDEAEAILGMFITDPTGKIGSPSRR